MHVYHTPNSELISNGDYAHPEQAREKSSELDGAVYIEAGPGHRIQRSPHTCVFRASGPVTNCRAVRFESPGQKQHGLLDLAWTIQKGGNILVGTYQS